MKLLLDALAVIAALLYAGALLALGAVVAPVIFRSGAPQAADLMTSVFTRFDRVAVVLVVVSLGAEAASLAMRKSGLDRRRLARAAAFLVFAAGVGVQSGALSPSIARMHREGVSRSSVEGAARFDRVHKTSSLVGKITVFAAFAAAALVLAERARQAR